MQRDLLFDTLIHPLHCLLGIRPHQRHGYEWEAYDQNIRISKVETVSEMLIGIELYLFGYLHSHRFISPVVSSFCLIAFHDRRKLMTLTIFGSRQKCRMLVLLTPYGGR